MLPHDVLHALYGPENHLQKVPRKLPETKYKASCLTIEPMHVLSDYGRTLILWFQADY